MKAYPLLSRRSPEDKVLGTFDRLFTGAAFELQLPGRPSHLLGQGEPAFQILVRNQTGVAALGSLNENRIGEAYLNGDIDLDGDVVAALDLRTELRNQRRLAYLFTTYGLGYLWATYVQPRVFGQVKCDERWISQHYDLESDFYLLFLDKQARCYSHGYFSRDDEPLEAAIQRKLDTAITACGIRPGMRVLDIGAGWGAFTAHAGRQGIQVTSLTISAESERYVRDLIARERLPCRVLLEHFLEHTTDEPYDAIVNLGVTEHLPDYAATLAQYRRLLRPGGRVFLDACASRRKYPFSAFVRSHIWPGNTTPMHLASYLSGGRQEPIRGAVPQKRPSQLPAHNPALGREPRPSSRRSGQPLGRIPLPAIQDLPVGMCPLLQQPDRHRLPAPAATASPAQRSSLPGVPIRAGAINPRR